MKGAGTEKAPRGPRIPQQARSRRTRRRILEAAVGCFEAHGYDVTTTAAIASAAGIAVGTLYGYFKDKRTVLLELLDTTVTQVAEHVLQGLQVELWRGREPRRQVRALIDAVFHARTLRPGIQRILWERYFRDPEFRGAVEAIERRVRAAMEELFTALRAEGQLRVADVHTATFVVYMAVEWTASRLVLGGADAETDAAVEAASDMVWRFLFKDAV